MTSGRVYVGPYVTIKERGSYKTDRPTCPNSSCVKHSNFLNRKFCWECGSPIEIITYDVETEFNLAQFLIDEFNDEDRFTSTHHDQDTIVLGNRRSQGGRYVDFEFEPLDLFPYDLTPSKVIDVNEDWREFMGALDSKGISHEFSYGVVLVRAT